MDDIIIKMCVLNDGDFLSPYSSNDMPSIKEEVASFLENQCLSNKAYKPITIEISSNCIKSEDKSIYEAAIKKYYQNKSIEYKYLIKKDTILPLILLIIAFIIMITHFFYHGNSAAIIEIIDIIAWSFTCEAVEKFCFERTGLVRHLKRANCFINAKINYVDKEK